MKGHEESIKLLQEAARGRYLAARVLYAQWAAASNLYVTRKHVVREQRRAGRLADDARLLAWVYTRGAFTA